MEEELRVIAAEYLNEQGYDIEIDSDGMWMEDQIFQDHKTKEVCDLMIGFLHSRREAERPDTSREMLEAMERCTQYLHELVARFGYTSERYEFDIDGAIGLLEPVIKKAKYGK